MPHALLSRRLEVSGHAHLQLDPDPANPSRYLVYYCGLDRDPAARAATEHARVRLLLASQRGQAAYPYPLPPRLVIGTLDQAGWHPGGSDYARALAGMPAVVTALDELLADLLLRVALVAARRTADPDAPTV